MVSPPGRRSYVSPYPANPAGTGSGRALLTGHRRPTRAGLVSDELTAVAQPRSGT
jgi:hypothetical protein